MTNLQGLSARLAFMLDNSIFLVLLDGGPVSFTESNRDSLEKYPLRVSNHALMPAANFLSFYLCA